MAGVQALLPHVHPCLRHLQESDIPIRAWPVMASHGLTVETDTPESAARAIALSEGLFPNGCWAIDLTKCCASAIR